MRDNFSQSYIQTLNSIFDEIRSSGYQINLDYVDFSFLSLIDLNLSEASMVAAKFISSDFLSTQMRGADLTGALFRDVNISNTNFTGALFVKSVLERVTFTSGTDMSGADTTKAVFFKVKFQCIPATGMISDDERLVDAIKKAHSISDNRLISQRWMLFYKNICNRLQIRNQTS